MLIFTPTLDIVLIVDAMWREGTKM